MFSVGGLLSIPISLKEIDFKVLGLAFSLQASGGCWSHICSPRQLFGSGFRSLSSL